MLKDEYKYNNYQEQKNEDKNNNRNFNHRTLGIFSRDENMSNKIGTWVDYLNQEIKKRVVNKNVTWTADIILVLKFLLKISNLNSIHFRRICYKLHDWGPSSITNSRINFSRLSYSYILLMYATGPIISQKHTKS